MSSEINTHGMVVDFGKHKGKRYTRIPVGYLLWMVQSNHSRIEIARAELKRRGTVLPSVDISGHAVDNASLRCRGIWKDTMREGEGLHAWLCRMSTEALEGVATSDGETVKVSHNGMKLVFEISGNWPVLKTVMRKGKGKKNGKGIEERKKDDGISDEGAAVGSA